VIVATVGHVDHGKTALVRALTGVDTDRLPEEKARGMSIELGFAYRAARGGAIVGFVDVPGHERFVPTMLAGVSGIRHALVVLAADDGPMPQTREHLAILDLLGVRSATLVITKIDRAAAARVAEVEAEARSLLAGAGLSDCAVHRVCAPRGDGLEALWTHLEALAGGDSLPAPRGHFRLAADRSFTLPGVGLVVTGIAFAGSIALGERVAVCPGGARARVRGLHAQNRPARSAQAGERCALNLAGTEGRHVAVRRGDWIVAEALNAPSARIDVRLRTLREAPALRPGERVHVHHGAKETTGRVVPLQAPRFQLLLDEPIAALWGDRLVLRDWSARRTCAGGVVLDPFPPARGRSRPQRLEALGALESADAAQALRGLLAAQAEGVDLARFALARNLTARERERVFGAVGMVRLGTAEEALGIAPARWAGARERLLGCVEASHREHPESWGPDEGELRRALGREAAPAVFATRIRTLLEEGALERHGTRLHRPGYRPVLSAQDLALWQRIEPLLAAGGVRPPPVGHLAATLEMTPPATESFLRRVAEFGFVAAVADNRFYSPSALAALARAACALADEHDDGRFSAAEFRDRTGIGRNVTIKVLEYFDRCGLTRRAGERRRVLARPEQVFGEAPALESPRKSAVPGGAPGLQIR